MNSVNTMIIDNEQCEHYARVVLNDSLDVSDVKLGSDDEDEVGTECSDTAQLAPREFTVVTGAQELDRDDGHTVTDVSPSFVPDEKSIAETEDWLRQNVIIQYWKGECDIQPNAAYRFSNIAVDWLVFELCDSTCIVCNYRVICL